MNHPGAAPSGGLRALSPRELAALNFPPVEHVAVGVPVGALVLAVGRPKLGKSLLFSVDLATSVARGDDFLGEPTIQGPALIVSAEDALPLVADRLLTRLGGDVDAPVRVVPVDGSLPQRLRLDDPTSFAALAALVEAERPRLIVLDPLVELHRRDENSADETSALMRPLRQLAHESGAGVVLIHHANKHGEDPVRSARGSSAIPAGADVVMTLKAGGAGDDDADDLDAGRVVRLHVEGRFGPPRRLAVRLGPGLRWHPADATRGADLPTADRVRRHLELTGEWLTTDQLAGALALPFGTVANAMTRLVREGTVSHAGAGTRADPRRHAAAVTRREPSVTNPPRPLPESAIHHHGSGPPAPAVMMNRDAATKPRSDADVPVERNGRDPRAIWVCGACGLPRSRDANPCPGCRTTGGRWFNPNLAPGATA